MNPAPSQALRRTPSDTLLAADDGALSRPARFAGCALALGLVYFAAVRIGLGFRFANSQIGIVWPATAVMMSALLLTPVRHWWLVFVSTAIAHVAAVDPSLPAWRWSWQILGNAAFAVTTVEVLRRVAGVPLNFATRRQVIAFLAVIFVMPAIFAFTTPAFVRSMRDLEAFSPSEALSRTYLTNATGMLLLIPVAALWWRAWTWSFGSSQRAREALLVAAVLISVGAIVFGSGRQLASEPWILLLTLIPLLWAAMRFGPRGASLALLAVAVMSAWGASFDVGPFVFVGASGEVLSLHLFWIVLWIPVMLLAASAQERLAAEKAFAHQHNQLAHLKRVATAGELSGALAHELRQPLTAIMLSAETARLMVNDTDKSSADLRELLDVIVEQNKHAAGVISRLQSFVKSETPYFRRLHVEDIVRDAVSLARGAIASGRVVLETHIDEMLPEVEGERVQLLQVLLNLIINASEAMREAGSPVRRLRISAARKGADRVVVSVCDTGTGLKNAAKVFEAFYTTKEKGMGLGLAISRTIAEAHNGRLWAENNAGTGATFYLELPAAD